MEEAAARGITKKKRMIKFGRTMKMEIITIGKSVNMDKERMRKTSMIVQKLREAEVVMVRKMSMTERERERQYRETDYDEIFLMKRKGEKMRKMTKRLMEKRLKRKKMIWRMEV